MTSVRDPLARVRGALVEDGRAGPDRHVPDPLRESDREDVAALVGLPEGVELGDRAVLSREAAHLGLDTVGAVVGAPDLEAILRLECRAPGHGPALAVAHQLDLDPLVLKRRALASREHEVEAQASAGAFDRRDVVSLLLEGAQLVDGDPRLVHVELAARGRGRRDQPGDNRQGQRGNQHCAGRQSRPRLSTHKQAPIPPHPCGSSHGMDPGGPYPGGGA